MGRIGCLALVIVALVVGYQQLSIRRMRKQVSAISARFGMEVDKNGEGSDLVTALAEAERHAKNAKELISANKLKEARAELDKVLGDLKRANYVSRDIVGDAAGFLGKARNNAVKMFQKAWDDISEETKQKDKQ